VTHARAMAFLRLPVAYCVAAPIISVVSFVLSL
jgi:hypothetical protein